MPRCRQQARHLPPRRCRCRRCRPCPNPRRLLNRTLRCPTPSLRIRCCPNFRHHRIHRCHRPRFRRKHHQNHHQNHRPSRRHRRHRRPPRRRQPHLPLPPRTLLIRLHRQPRRPRHLPQLLRPRPLQPRRLHRPRRRPRLRHPPTPRQQLLRPHQPLHPRRRRPHRHRTLPGLREHGCTAPRPMPRSPPASAGDGLGEASPQGVRTGGLCGQFSVSCGFPPAAGTQGTAGQSAPCTLNPPSSAGVPWQ